MTSNTDAKPVTDEEILEDIIRQMQDGVSPWRKPWADSAAGVVVGSLMHDAMMWPSNLRAPKTPYGVFNGTVLLTRASTSGYRTNLWVTREVVDSLGVGIVDEDDRPTAIKRYREHEAYRGSLDGVRLVYNIDQVADCEKSLGLAFCDKKPLKPSMHFEKARDLMKRLVKHHSLQIVQDDRAAYSPSWNVVMMPGIERFHAAMSGPSQVRTAEANYWATLWHEVVHWTGHPSRLDRDRHVRWGDKIYAFEELIAELGAAFLCAHLGISGELQHESYLDSWCRVLKQEGMRALWAACGRATAAKNFVLAKQENSSNQRGFLG